MRGAAGRLQRVVAGLLVLFRSGAEVQPVPLDLAVLAARVPMEGLLLEAPAGAGVAADADLLTAVLLNLLDNALRHGARRVLLSSPAPNRLRVHDDGCGVPAAQRLALQQALEDPVPFAALLRECSDLLALLQRPLRHLLNYHCGVGAFRTRQMMLDIQSL